jgi:hypothetical protein
MVAHVVLFTPRADLSSAERHALAAALERAARAIPDVQRVSVGRRVLHGAGYERESTGAVEFVAIVEFRDLQGLHAYLRHPVHEELSQRFRQSLASAQVYDFEGGGVEELERLVSGKTRS